MKPFIKPFHIYEPTRPANPDLPVLIFEFPHAHNFKPPEYPLSIARERLNSHEGYDPGALDLFRCLLQQFGSTPNAWFITGQISRLVVDHNRVPEISVQLELQGPLRQYFIDTYARPYTDAVFGLIEGAILARNFPIVCNVHTYNPELGGYERAVFSVSGDPNAAIVKTMFRNLFERLNDRDYYQFLAPFNLPPDKLLDAINRPYNLGPLLEDGSENPRINENMAMRYALNYGHPWVHVEVRNDFAKTDIIQKILADAYEATLNDPEVIAEWKHRREVYFNLQTVRMRLSKPFDLS